jgi:hypothetical protein
VTPANARRVQRNALKAAGGRLGQHNRWHVRGGRPNPTACTHCREEAPVTDPDPNIPKQEMRSGNSPEDTDDGPSVDDILEHVERLN